MKSISSHYSMPEGPVTKHVTFSSNRSIKDPVYILLENDNQEHIVYEIRRRNHSMILQMSVIDNMLIFVCGDLYIINTATHELIHKFIRETLHGRFIIDGNYIYLEDGVQLHCLDISGKHLWTSAKLNVSDISLQKVENGRIYAINAPYLHYHPKEIVLDAQSGLLLPEKSVRTAPLSALIGDRILNVFVGYRESPSLSFLGIFLSMEKNGIINFPTSGFMEVFDVHLPEEVMSMDGNTSAFVIGQTIRQVYLSTVKEGEVDEEGNPKDQSYYDGSPYPPAFLALENGYVLQEVNEWMPLPDDCLHLYKTEQFTSGNITPNYSHLSISPLQ